MIERHLSGTKEIPYPHKIFHWRNGDITMTVELDPLDHSRRNPPKIEGWEPFFIGFHGYDKPMHYSYRPV